MKPWNLKLSLTYKLTLECTCLFQITFLLFCHTKKGQIRTKILSTKTDLLLFVQLIFGSLQLYFCHVKSYKKKQYCMVS